MDTLSFEKRAALAIKRLIFLVGARIKRVLGGAFQLVAHDQLGDLSRQTQRLGSASVESVTYLGGELRALDERLSRIEDELAALRAALGAAESGEAQPNPDEIASGPHSG